MATFIGADGERLADEVRKVLRRDKQALLLIHEQSPSLGSCAFDFFFQSMPPNHVASGVYSSIAVAFHDGPFREVSVALAAEKLGAVRDGARRASIGRHVEARCSARSSGRIAPAPVERQVSLRVLAAMGSVPQVLQGHSPHPSPQPPRSHSPSRTPNPIGQMLMGAGKAIAMSLRIGGFEHTTEEQGEASSTRETHSIDARSHRNLLKRGSTRPVLPTCGSLSEVSCSGSELKSERSSFGDLCGVSAAATGFRGLLPAAEAPAAEGGSGMTFETFTIASQSFKLGGTRAAPPRPPPSSSLSSSTCPPIKRWASVQSNVRAKSFRLVKEEIDHRQAPKLPHPQDTVGW